MVDESLHTRLRVVAAMQGRSMSSLVREAVIAIVEMWEEQTPAPVCLTTPTPIPDIEADPHIDTALERLGPSQI